MYVQLNYEMKYIDGALLKPSLFNTFTTYLGNNHSPHRKEISQFLNLVSNLQTTFLLSHITLLTSFIS